MSVSPPRHVLLNQSFADFDHLAEQVRQWNLEFQQLDRGSFRGELMQWVGGGFSFAEARFHRTLTQQGNSPPGLRTIAIPATDQRCVTWRGRDVKANQLICYPDDGALDAVSHPSFHVYVLSLTNDMLAAAAQAYDLPEWDDSAQGQLVSIEPTAIRRLRFAMQQVGNRLHETGEAVCGKFGWRSVWEVCRT